MSLSEGATRRRNWNLAGGEADRFPRQDVNARDFSRTEAPVAPLKLEVWDYRHGKG